MIVKDLSKGSPFLFFRVKRWREWTKLGQVLKDHCTPFLWVSPGHSKLLSHCCPPHHTHFLFLYLPLTTFHSPPVMVKASNRGKKRLIHTLWKKIYLYIIPCLWARLKVFLQGDQTARCRWRLKTQKKDKTIDINIERKESLKERKNPKDNNIWLMHDTAVEPLKKSWSRRLET